MLYGAIFLVATLSMQGAGETLAVSDMRVEALRCEYAPTPLNVDVSHPKLSWQLQAPGRNRRQTAYQIQAAGNLTSLLEENNLLWDTGKIDTASSTHIPYKGAPLKSNQSVYWRVRVWDGQGLPTPFSPPALFGTAILQPEDWQAQWIGFGSSNDPKNALGYYNSATPKEDPERKTHPGSILLRKQFVVQKPVHRARCFAAGLGWYEMYINGQRVGDRLLAPTKTNYTKEVLYDVYDVTSLLSQGKSVVGMMLGNGWFNPQEKWLTWRMQFFGDKRARVQIHIEYEDGSQDTLLSDSSWKGHEGPVVRSCVYDGENYDATRECTGWTLPGYNDSEWQPVCPASAPKGALRAQTAPPIQKTDTLTPVACHQPEPGMLVYDLGQNIAGWARIQVSGRKGDKVQLRFAENLTADHHLDTISNNKARPVDTYILKGEGSEIYEPHFTFHGFRYVELTGEPNLPAIEKVEGCAVHSNCTPTGSFTCDNDALNRLHTCIHWTQRNNMVGYPMDCPQRDERLGWMGDAQVIVEEALYNFDMALFYRQWLRGIHEDQTDDGALPYISPRPPLDPSRSVAWSAAYGIVLWQNYLFYGDSSLIEMHYPTLCRYISYLGAQAKDHILPPDCYSDWASANLDGKSPLGFPESVSTAYYYHMATLASKMAGVLGKQDEQTVYTDLSNEIADAYNARFFNTDAGFYENGTECTQAIPLQFGLVPKKHQNVVLTQLLAALMKKNKGRVTTGILGTKAIVNVLEAAEHNATLYFLATQPEYPGWQALIKNRTTLSEHWDQSISNDHIMFGSIDPWFYSALGGIRPIETAPGFAAFEIRPFCTPALSHTKTALKTIRGEIKTHWRLQENDLHLEVHIPVNTQAMLTLPAVDAAHVLESGHPLTQHDDMRLVVSEAGRISLQLGSGAYHFISTQARALLPLPFTAPPKLTPYKSLYFSNEDATIELTSATPTAEIHYTLDTTEPTRNSPSYRDPIPITRPVLLRAKAFCDGYQPSVTSDYPLSYVDPDQNGLTCQRYHGRWSALPDFTTLTPVETTTTYQMGFEGMSLPREDFALTFDGFLEITEPGEYTFYTLSNDGSQLFINDALVVDNDQEHGILEKSGTVQLSPGKHPIRITYFQSGGGCFLKVAYEGPHTPRQALPSHRLYQSKE